MSNSESAILLSSANEATAAAAPTTHLSPKQRAFFRRSVECNVSASLNCCCTVQRPPHLQRPPHPQRSCTSPLHGHRGGDPLRAVARVLREHLGARRLAATYLRESQQTTTVHQISPFQSPLWLDYLGAFLCINSRANGIPDDSVVNRAKTL